MIIITSSTTSSFGEIEVVSTQLVSQIPDIVVVVVVEFAGEAEIALVIEVAIVLVVKAKLELVVMIEVEVALVVVVVVVVSIGEIVSLLNIYESMSSLYVSTLKPKVTDSLRLISPKLSSLVLGSSQSLSLSNSITSHSWF